ncbi:hypothetical protein X924_02150 [Petrotoga sp. 9PWA.NaAc.5.4]|nr:hypothetical protein X924_02150 [Petrotoga sp. 9PWA.NaAc.5.4]
MKKISYVQIFKNIDNLKFENKKHFYFWYWKDTQFGAF